MEEDGEEIERAAAGPVLDTSTAGFVRSVGPTDMMIFQPLNLMGEETFRFSCGSIRDQFNKKNESETTQEEEVVYHSARTTMIIRSKHTTEKK